MVTGRDRLPGGMPLETEVAKVNTLSPAVTSPFVPVSENACVPEPPIWLKSPVTVIPVLTGLAPGVTVTVRSVAAPACTEFGLATPVPEGGFEAGFTVSENTFVAVVLPSFTCMVKENGEPTEVVGVPLRVAPVSVRPGG